ncbi:hypothetical protein BVH65_12435 [Vibrio cholerae]|nr:hypothetical protein [Vibrio cholerae]MBO1369464.1 hypothetical protein [Vibrio cholerae]MBO1373964.1 hypothetical protein [Vibrio cholerae]MBO1378087.1 hypothetical protein [Vibrio cholerae]MBO1408153.1 hypothetical protein [Vibrio cholerae]
MVLAAFAQPNYFVYLCWWGFTYLPPTCNFKSFEDINMALILERHMSFPISSSRRVGCMLHVVNRLDLG